MAVAAPNLDSARSAVDVLQAELELADGNLDSLDRKAALLPPLLVALVGLLWAPDAELTAIQFTLLAPAGLFGVISVVLALVSLHARPLVIGPDVDRVSAGVHLAPEDFHKAVAGSLAIAVNTLTAVAVWKAEWFNRSLVFAGATILLTTLARVIGTLP